MENIIHIDFFTARRGCNRTGVRQQGSELISGRLVDELGTENALRAAATALTGADTLAEGPSDADTWHHVSEAAERALSRLWVG